MYFIKNPFARKARFTTNFLSGVALEEAGGCGPHVREG